MDQINLKVLLHKTASPRDKIVMMMLINSYGQDGFTDSFTGVAAKTGFPVSIIVRTIGRLKKLGWITTKRVYGPGTHNLRFVEGCEYSITL
jgi:hypothetical protein